jgi:hypothetical protein
MTKRYRIFSLIAFGIAASTVSNAATREQGAVMTGNVVGSYNQARFRCLAAGIPMPTFAELHPELVSTVETLKSTFPDFFALGSAEGVKQANYLLKGDPSEFRKGCESFKNLK